MCKWFALTQTSLDFPASPHRSNAAQCMRKRGQRMYGDRQGLGYSCVTSNLLPCGSVQDFNQQALSNMLWAYSILRHHPGDTLLIAACQQIHSRLGEFNAQVRVHAGLGQSHKSQAEQQALFAHAKKIRVLLSRRVRRRQLCCHSATLHCPQISCQIPAQ